jgi:hypothetical protein
MMLLPRLYGKGVVISILSVVRSFENNTVVAFNPFSMRERRIEGVDTLVLATGSMANDGLWKALHGQVKEIYGAGECVAPRKMLESTLDGLRVGLQL